MNTKSLKKKTLQSGLWLFLRKFSVKLINLAAIYILARKLTPSDFGLVALASVALRLVTGSISQTTSTYIIYDNSENWKDKANTGFWLNSILLIIIFIILYPILPWLVSFYKGGPQLKKIILIFFAVFVFQELRSIPDAFLKKKLLYNKLVLRDTALDILGAILSVVMALKNFGVWSLVIPPVVTSIVSFPIALLQSQWFPSVLSLKYTREILKYTLHVMGTNILTFLGNEGDTLITGKLLGFRKLGIYNRAYASANLITYNIKSVVQEVSFPALSLLNKDRKKLDNAFLGMLRYISLIGFPLTIGLVVLGKEFILTLYGNQWVEAVLPMQILAIMALRRIIGSPAGIYFNAIGKPEVMFKFGIIFIPFYLISVFVGALYGIVGVAIAVTFIRTIGGFIIFVMVTNEMKTSLVNILAPFLYPLVFSLLMGVVITLSKHLFPISSPVIALVFYGSIGVIFYGIGCMVNPNIRRIILNLLHHIVK